MSGKAEKTEKSSGSKIKKKPSFRDDIKAMIKRRPSAPSQSPKSKSKSLNRTHSLNEGSKTDKHDKDITIDDVDKLKIEVDHVYKSLKYIKEVVDKETLQILPATASAVLETVTGVFTLLSNFFSNQDSSMMLSRHNQVCQCLAHLIRWADKILLYGNDQLNKDNAHEVIKALADGMKELAQASIDKLENRKNGIPRSPGPINAPFHQERMMSKSSTEESELETPPPLPEKQRISSATTLNMMGSSKGDSNGHSSSSQSPLSSMLFPSPSQDHSLGGCSNSSGLVTPSSQSPRSCSPLSRSPASSIGSGLNQSMDDLLSSSNRSSRTNSFSYASSDSRSATMESSVEYALAVDEINQLTKKINQLTTSIKDVPPPVPAKGSKSPRFPSHYDNVPLGEGSGGLPVSGLVGICANTTGMSQTISHMSSHSTSCSSSSSLNTRMVSHFNSAMAGASGMPSFSHFHSHKSSSYFFSQSSQETISSSEFSSGISHSSLESLHQHGPPPLPPKKKHIQTYMQTFGSCVQPNATELAHISRRSLNFFEAEWKHHQKELHRSIYPRSNTISVISDISSGSSDNTSGIGSAENMGTPPALPAKLGRSSNRQSQASTISSQSDASIEGPAEVVREKSASMIEPPVVPPTTPEMELKRSSAPAEVSEQTKKNDKSVSPKSEILKDADSDFIELKPLDDVDVSDQLIRKRQTEVGPEIRGGSVDALLVHATVASKSGSQEDLVNEEDFMYQEAFLTTYRTFITPKDLIEKLLYRFHKFQHVSDTSKKRLARNAFSLLIRVLDELSSSCSSTSSEIDDEISQKMMDLVFELLCQGELTLAKLLRRKIVEKLEARKHMEITAKTNNLPSHSLTLQLPDLLHFKSQDIAEQMTLLDAGLFQKIEIPEVLLWAKEQSEELSPNLTLFTEHFNKMSYWCRTKILIQEEPKDREKYLMKFIKIMRHLRKMSNFNSYLAILSALDSAPIRRLEWQKQNMEALKEFCQLIDSSASFRAYRQALSETEPPCIPYLGLILQDLTFINIGNQDLLQDGSINFAKRWQQFNILEIMRRFRKCNFDFKKSEKILAVFDGFDDYKCEDELWQISEKIKPRGGKRKATEPGFETN
ncbi:rap guanine nucleotide exchange factor 1-like isoform X1 [Octopus vulgaris]|uniref:CRK SH3-binding GNRP n=1 Tax=Octopus vulgaris TaxID=6645 RepID=A0AA36AHU9_OCTVU|nr:rap guanine nucleotide exchange factor 1-like isoform X1 [Octopus vulgaris]